MQFELDCTDQLQQFVFFSDIRLGNGGCAWFSLSFRLPTSTLPNFIYNLTAFCPFPFASKVQEIRGEKRQHESATNSFSFRFFPFSLNQMIEWRIRGIAISGLSYYSHPSVDLHDKLFIYGWHIRSSHTHDDMTHQIYGRVAISVL